MERSTACVVDHQDLTGIKFPHHVGPDHVQGRSLRGQHPAAVQATQTEWSEAIWVAHTNNPVAVGQHEGERPGESGQDLGESAVEGLAGSQVRPVSEFGGQQLGN